MKAFLLNGAKESCLARIGFFGRRHSWFIACLAGAALVLPHRVGAAAPDSVVVWGQHPNAPTDLTDVVELAAGRNHSLALRLDGTVVAWGANDSGQTNVPANLSNIVAIAVGEDHSMALDIDGRLSVWGSSANTNVPSAATNVIAIAAGTSHSLAVRSDGTVVAWGADEQGQSQVPTGLADVSAVAAGQAHSVALRRNGSVVVWGYAPSTNVPPQTTNVIAIAAGKLHSLALRRDGTLVGWGRTAFLTTAPPSASNVVRISAGAVHNMVLRSDGTVVVWGLNTAEQTVVPADLRNVTAVSGGAAHSLAVVGRGLPLFPQTQPLWTVVSGTDVKLDARAVGGPLSFYQWRFNGSLLGETNHVLHVGPASTNYAGIYSVETMGSTGTSTGALQLAVAGPRVVLQPVSRTNFVGSTATFTVGVEALEPVQYQWFFNGEVLPGATNSVLSVESVRLDQSGQYHARIQDSVGVTLSSSATLVVIRPRIVQQPASRTNFVGSTATFTVGVEGFEPVQYQWFFNGEVLPGATNSVLTLESVRLDQAGQYFARIQDGVGPMFSSNATLVVLRPRIIQQPASRTNFVGSTATFTVDVEGFEPVQYQYQWFFNGEVLPGATNSVLTLASVRFDQAGEYFTRIQDGVGPVFSSNATLVVNNVTGWGLNSSGQLNVPLALTNVISIAAGVEHTVALTDQGHVHAWGGNTYGQTNVPMALTNIIAIAGGYYHTLALKADRAVVAWGQNDHGQTNVPIGLSNVIGIAAGRHHSVALRSNGTIVAWGSGIDGQTNVPPYLTNVVAITAGLDHSAALLANGRVVAWGKNDWGEVTVSPYLDRVVAIAAGAAHTFALRDDGTIVAWGLGNVGQSTPPVTATNIIAIAGGYHHSLALRQDGVVLAWGYNANGQINVPAQLSNVVAIAGGNFHSVAVVGDGQISIPNPSMRRDVLPGTTIVLNALAAGGRPLAFQWRFNGIDITGETNAWLSLTNLQMAQSGIYSVVVSNAFGVAISETVLQVSNAPPAFSYQPVSVQTYPGGSAMFEAVAYGSEPIEYQWLYNGSPLAGETNRTLTLTSLKFSQQGNYSVVAQNAFGMTASSDAGLLLPQVIGYGYYYSLQPNCAFPSIFIPQDLSNGVAAVSCGDYFSLALMTNGLVKAWGNLQSGGYACATRWDQTNVPPGLSNVVAIAAGSDHSLALRSDGSVVTWGNPGGLGRLTNGVPDLTNIAAIAAGDNRSVALTTTGKVLIWGFSGGTNVVPSLTNVVAIAAGGRLGLALRENGTVVAWGTTLGGATDVPAGLSNVVTIAAGMRSSRNGYGVALRADGSVVSWGTFISPPPAEATNIVAVATGDMTLGLRPDGTLFTWNCGFVPCPPPDLTNVFAVATGGAHVLIMVDDEFPSRADFVPSVVRPQVVNGEFSVLLPTIRGQVYAFEFKNSLLEPAWNSLSLVLGDGTVKELKHNAVGTSQRFYRVRRWR